jgi:hypothetical protein
MQNISDDDLDELVGEALVKAGLARDPHDVWGIGYRAYNLGPTTLWYMDMDTGVWVIGEPTGETDFEKLEDALDHIKKMEAETAKPK